MIRPALRILLLAPALALAVLSLLSPSSGGGVSVARLVFHAVYLGALVSCVSRRPRGLVWQAALAPLAILGGTFLLPANNALIGLPFLFPLLHLARVALAALVILEAVRSASRAALAVGATLLALLVVDAALVGLLTGARADGPVGYRRPVDPAALPVDGLVAIGDSFVWGSGVAEREAWVTLIGRTRKPVFNLGLRGAGPREYLGTLRRIRSVKRIVVAFYPNDLAPVPGGGERLRQAMLSAGRSSVICRLLGDLTGAVMFPGREEYEAQIVASWNEDEPSFPARFEAFRSAFSALARESRARSVEPPLFVMFPLVSRYDTYPLKPAHERVAALARENGVSLVDFLPLFSARFPHGESIRVAPDDTHFDAEAHAYVAAEIDARLR